MSFLQQLQQAIGRAPLGWRPRAGADITRHVPDVQPLGVTPIDTYPDVYPLGITPIDNGPPVDYHPLGITPIDIGYPQPLGVTPIDVGFPQPQPNPTQIGGGGFEKLFKTLLLFLLLGLFGRR